MQAPESITFTRAWGRFKPGQKARILYPDHEWRDDSVDPVRAARLVEDEFAYFAGDEPRAAEPEPEPEPHTTRPEPKRRKKTEA